MRRQAGSPAEYRARTRFPDSLSDALDRARAIGNAARAIGACLEARSAASMYAQPNQTIAAAAVRLDVLADGRGALAARARDAVRALRDAMAGGIVADALAIGERLERATVACNAAAAYSGAEHALEPGFLTLENHATHYTAIETAERNTRRAAEQWPEVWADRARMAREALEALDAYRTIAAALRHTSGTARFASVADAMLRARDLLAAGMIFDAERNAARALEACNAGPPADTLATLDRIAGSELHRENVRAIAASEAARIRDAVEALAGLEAEARALCERIAPLAAAARADRLAHWRATGEGIAELQRVAAPGFAYFRRGREGSIVSSLGAVVPESAGRRLWAMIRAAAASGRGVDYGHNGGPRVGSFHVSRIGADGSAVVGCHSISATEARAFAEYMAWPPFGAETAADTLEGDAA
jgi:hypothetical protein